MSNKKPVDISDLVSCGFVKEQFDELVEQHKNLPLPQDDSIIEDKPEDIKVDKPLFDYIWDKTESIGKTFEEGRRNAFIFYFSRQTNRFGLPLDFVIEELDKKVSIRKHSKHLIRLESEYKLYPQQHGIYNKPNSVPEVEEEQPSYETPIIDKEVIKKLPKIFQDIAGMYNKFERERDVAIFGLLTILSGAIHNVIVIHRNKTFYPRLFFVISAGFASGKGVLDDMRRLGEGIHYYLKDKARKAWAEYEQELIEYKQKIKDGESAEKPVEPILPTFFIPVDASAAAFKLKFAKAGGKATMLETESDTMSSVLSQDWAGKGYSLILRKSWQHEAIDFLRLGLDEEIINPQLSMIVAGTPKTVVEMIPSAENGLFSRVGYYSYEVEPELDDETFGYSKWKENEDRFLKYSNQILKLYQELEKQQELGNKIIFHWEKGMQKKMKKVFKDWLDQYKAIVGNEGAKIVFRIGVMATRIAGILSVLRMIEENQGLTLDELFGKKDTNKEIWITCSQIDFENTVHIIDIIRQHTFNIYENLPQEEAKQRKTKKSATLKFFNALPKRFPRKNAVKVGAEHDVAERTVGKYLKLLLDKGLLDKDNKGNYWKTNENEK